MSHMDNNSDEGILNAHLATRVIEQSNATDAAIFWQLDIPRETPQNQALRYSRYHNDRPMQLFYTDGISKRISTRKGYGAGRRLLKH